MAIDDNTSYELTGYQVKDLAGRIRRKAEASSVPTSISDLGQVTSSDIDWSTIGESAACTYAANYAARSSDPVLMVFKLGKIVVLTGAAQNTVQRSFGNFWHEEKVATVPEGFRPAANYSGGLHRGSGASMYRAYVKTNGDLGYTQANRSAGTSGETFESGSFFPFMMVWVTD